MENLESSQPSTIQKLMVLGWRFEILNFDNQDEPRSYRGFQLLPGRFRPFFVNLLGRFYPPYMPGGEGGCFDDVKITIPGTSKMFRTTPSTGMVGDFLTKFDQIVQISFKKWLLPQGNLSQNSQNYLELPVMVILMSSKQPSPLANKGGGENGLIS